MTFGLAERILREWLRRRNKIVQCSKMAKLKSRPEIGRAHV
jgi:hypothetical protein